MKAKLTQAFLEASPDVRAHYRVLTEGGQVISFTDDKVLLMARRGPGAK